MDDVSYNELAVLLAPLAKIEPCPFAGKVTPDQIKVVLGNVANIWPASIAIDVAYAKGRGVF